MRISEAIQIILDARLAKQGAQEASQAFDKVDQSGRKMKTGLDEAGKSLDKVGREATELGKDVRTISKGMEDAGLAIDRAGREARDLGQSLRDTNRAIDQTGRSFDRGGKEARQFDSQVRRAERTLDRFGATTRTSGTAITRLFLGFAGFEAIRRSISTISELEAGIISISKTTQITGVELQELDDGIKRIAASVPVATKELLDIGAAAGRLGVQSKADIEAFVETVGRLTLTSDLQGEKAATTIARLLNVTGEQFGEVTKVGSVITRLGNNFAATESEIAAVATRVAQTTAAFGVSSEEALAFGAALKAFGVNAELAGGAFGRSFRLIERTIAEGGVQFDRLAEIAGTTTDQFADLFSADAVAGFGQFISGLNRIGEAGGSTAQALRDVGLSASRDAGVFQTLSKNSKELERALKLANDESETQNELFRESGRRAESLSSRYQLLKNSITSALDVTGENFVLDSLKFLTDGLSEAINRITGLADETPDATDSVEALATAFNTLGGAITFALAGGALARLPALLGLLGATTPIGLGLGAVGGAIGLGFALSDLGSSPRQRESQRDPLESFADRIAELEKRSAQSNFAASEASTEAIRLQFLEDQLAADRARERAYRDAIRELGDPSNGGVTEASLEKIFKDEAKNLIDSLRESAFSAFREAVEGGNLDEILAAADDLTRTASVSTRYGGNDRARRGAFRSATITESLADFLNSSGNIFGEEGRNQAILDQARLISQRGLTGDIGVASLDRKTIIEKIEEDAIQAGASVDDLAIKTGNLRRELDGAGFEDTDLGRFFAGLREEIDLIGKTDQEIQRLSLTRQFESLAIDDQSDSIDKQRDAFNRLVDELEAAQDAEDRLRSLEQLGRSAFETIVGGFAEGTLRGQEFIETLEQVALQLSRIGLQKVLEIASDALFSGFGASGRSGQVGSPGFLPSDPDTGPSASGGTPLSVTINNTINGAAGPSTFARLTSSTRQAVNDASRQLNSR